MHIRYAPSPPAATWQWVRPFFKKQRPERGVVKYKYSRLSNIWVSHNFIPFSFDWKEQHWTVCTLSQQSPYPLLTQDRSTCTALETVVEILDPVVDQSENTLTNSTKDPDRSGKYLLRTTRFAVLYIALWIRPTLNHLKKVPSSG